MLRHFALVMAKCGRQTRYSLEKTISSCVLPTSVSVCRRMIVAAVVAHLGVILSLCLSQELTVVTAHSDCPPWHFTPPNASSPCSDCVWLYNSSVHCSDTGALVDVTTTVTTTNGTYPLFISRELFYLDPTKGLHKRSILFRDLPPNTSALDDFFCSSSDRRGYLCRQCKPGCGISVYTYFGLPCACPCYSYGIPLYILLEIGFSTIFYLLLVSLNISVISSKWNTVIFYFSLVAYIVSSQTHTHLVLSLSGSWVPIVLRTLYGVWNVDFFRSVIPKFCVSQSVSVLGAMSTGYISAFWPMVLVFLTSLVMHLHKRNFKIAVYPWKLLNWLSLGLVRRQVAGTNLIRVFATYFLLSHLKMVHISISIIRPYYTSRIPSETQSSPVSDKRSIDPHINYLSPGHLYYAVPATMILVSVGLVLPLSLTLYPTRCATWFGYRIHSRRLRNAARTFIEAFNGDFKDGTAGTRDYRAVPGLMLLLRGIGVAVFSFRGNEITAETTSILCVGILTMGLAGLFGLLQPYKTRRHNLYDVLIFCLTALQCFYLFEILTLAEYEPSTVCTVAVITFLPLLAVVVGVLRQVIVRKVLCRR